MAYLQPAAEFVTTFACGVFAGGAVYITLVEHPARIACGIELAATEFSPSYRRATVMQTSLAIAGFVFTAVAWLPQWRRLRVRHERRADIHEAFLTLGCALICWRYLL